MSQLGIKESRIAKVWEGIKLACIELSVNDGANIDRSLEEELRQVVAQENKGVIINLEEQTSSVIIPINDGIVKKARVSEERAKEEVAKKVEQGKNKEIDLGKQIGE